MADSNNAADTGVEAPAEGRPQSLCEKIIAVMDEVGFIEKREAKQGMKYDYIAHDDVAAALRPALIKHGIVVFPTITNHAKDGNRTELTVDVTFINASQPDDRLTVQAIGYGVDGQDKGPGKAMSYAVKYACMKMFMLNSADDVETSDTQHDPTDLRASQVVEKESMALEAQQAWSKSFKTALESAETVEAVNDLQKEHRRMIQAVPEVTRTYFIELIEQRKAALS